jgi:hypothetical protein
MVISCPSRRVDTCLNTQTSDPNGVNFPLFLNPSSLPSANNYLKRLFSTMIRPELKEIDGHTSVIAWDYDGKGPLRWEKPFYLALNHS